MNFYTHIPGSEALINQYNAGHLNVDDFVKQQFQILETRPRLEKVLSELQDIVNQGEQSLRTWNQSYDVLQSEESELISLAFRYFTFVGSILIQSAILQASKLTETNSDSVNLNYLFNLLLSEGKNHFHQNWDEIKRSVKNDQKIAQRFQPLISRLRIKRDKEIAHRDRIFVNSSLKPETHVEVQELSEFFHAVQEILARYHSYYFGFPPKQLHLNADELAYFGPEGLEDILTLALKSLEDETIQDVSEHIKQVRVWRKSRLDVQPEKTKLKGQDSQ